MTRLNYIKTTKMKMHEIITANESPSTSILTEALYPYRKSLLVYYRDLFCCEPLLMVTSVFNAAQYAKIVPANEFNEVLSDYLDGMDLDDETREYEEEVIPFNSIMLSDF